MAYLLFEGEHAVKISVVDEETECISIAMYDTSPDNTEYFEIALNFKEIDQLYDWISRQRYALQDIKKSKLKTN